MYAIEISTIDCSNSFACHRWWVRFCCYACGINTYSVYVQNAITVSNPWVEHENLKLCWNFSSLCWYDAAKTSNNIGCFVIWVAEVVVLHYSSGNAVEWEEASLLMRCIISETRTNASATSLVIYIDNDDNIKTIISFMYSCITT